MFAEAHTGGGHGIVSKRVSDNLYNQGGGGEEGKQNIMKKTVSYTQTRDIE